jgi:hypothetical protein
MKKHALIAVATTVAVVIAASAAAADGGPSPGVITGWDGVVGPSGSVRYVALQGGGHTMVAAVLIRSGRVLRYGTVPGAFGVPAVAYDGSTDGVSKDGRTLVLAPFLRPDVTHPVSRFALLSPKTLHLRRLVSLPGAFSFDALSPDGRTMFAIEYLSASPTAARYRVRAVDLVHGRLLPGTIVDKREADEPMRGQPVTRATSSDGAWAYTLYQRGQARPFIHALDTTRSAAFCIDLPWRNAAAAMWNVRLRLNGGRSLELWQPATGRLAVVDTGSLTVRAFRRPVAPGTQTTS